ncbi:MAG: SpvB/TcaC N-terminal domain-containing protein [Saprospiraceae bacterium]
MDTVPDAGIELLTPITATKTGAASTAFTLRLPPGRQGMEPALSISYSSEGGHTWCGTGWNIELDHFEVDTRWGVPRYDGDNESETYLFEGKMLYPVAHRGDPVTRETDKVFRFRAEEEFYRIIRHGSAPSNYWWEVTNKEGTTRCFGGSPSTGFDASAALLDDNGNIAHWAITLEIDANGNAIHFEHDQANDAGVVGSSNLGRNIYPSRIFYTGHNNERGAFSVRFVRDRELNETPRTDKRINARLGFKQVEADLLRHVEVFYVDTLIRHYELDYTSGAFAKTLLTSIAEFDSEGEEFYRHEFDYFDDLALAGSLLASPVSWTSPPDGIRGDLVLPGLSSANQASLLGATKTTSLSVGGAVTFGPLGSLLSKENTAGGTYNYTSGNAEGLLALLDINGDGLADKVFQENDELFYRPNLNTPGSGNRSFGGKRPVLNATTFSEANFTAHAFGAEANPAFAYVAAEYETLTTTTSTYFADFNGDELMDIATNGTVQFNHINADGDPTFTPSSDDTPSPIQAEGDIDPETIASDPMAQAALQDQYPLHDVVRMWRAPFDGQVNVGGSVQLLEDTSNAAQLYTKADGVQVSIELDEQTRWTRRIRGDDFTTYIPTGVNNLTVNAGDQIYFRVQSILDGAYDQVNWVPTVSYNNLSSSAIDPNRKQIHMYNAEEDYLMNIIQTVNFSYAGTINIEGAFSKLRTTDDAVVRIIQTRNDISLPIFEQTADWDQNSAFGVVLNNFRVEVGDELRFEVYSDTQLDWQAISWRPRVYYTAFDDGSQATDSNGDPLISFCPVVDFSMYNYFVQESQYWIAPRDADITINPDFVFANFYGGELTMSAKTPGRLLGKKTFSFTAGVTVGNQDLVVRVSAGDTLYVAFACENFAGTFLGDRFVGSNVSFSEDGDDYTIDVEVRSSIDEEDLIFGSLYRQWGQFIYNGNRSRQNVPIIEANLDLDAVDPGDDQIDPDIDPDDLMAPPVNNALFANLLPDIKTDRWVGLDANTYVTATTISSSRMGLDDILPPSNSSSGTGIAAPTIISESIQKSVGGGAVLSGGASWNDVVTKREVIDMNGDRFPDVVGEEVIQYTTTRGGLEEAARPHSLGAHTASSFAKGLAVGGSLISSGASNSGPTSGAGSNKRNSRTRSKSSKRSNNSSSSSEAANAGIGFSGSIGDDRDTTLHTWLDINGDGLEDKLYANGDARLSYGYTFGARENWGFDHIRTGYSSDVSLGAGINFLNGSITAGVSGAVTGNHSLVGFADLNDDALIDWITSENPLRVRYNTGAGFGPEQALMHTTQLDAGLSGGESVGGAVTFCIPILLVRICFNPSGGPARGIGKQTTSFEDMNGDGFADFVVSDSDGTMQVSESQIGRTNLLKSVRNPLGGSTALDYAFEGNSYGLPYSVWALKSIRSDDGLRGDGADEQLTTYAYNAPNYDRHERSFLGFGTVEIIHHDTENNDATYRTLVQEYAVDNLYQDGKLLRQAIYDADNQLLRETRHQIELLDTQTGQVLAQAEQRSDDGTAFVARTATTTTFFDPTGSDQLSARTEYDYDLLGNVLEINEVDADLTTSLVYHDDNVRYIKAFAKTSTKQTAGGVKRKTTHTYDDRGNLTQLVHEIGSGQAAVFDMSYDGFGNVTEVVRPANHAGQRLRYSYTYEDELNQYLFEESDSYGFTTSYTFDARTGGETSRVDIRGNTRSKGYDHRGRVAWELNAMDAAEGRTSSMEYTYLDQVLPNGLSVKRYDPEYDGVVLSYAFTDGFGRIVQTKNQQALHAAPDQAPRVELVVSGSEIFDAFGRVVEEYHPLTESISSGEIFNTGTDGVRPLRRTYDVLDRPLSMVERDGGETEIRYNIATDPVGRMASLRTSTDATGHVTETYFDERGRMLANRENVSSGTYHLVAERDGLGQLLSLRDERDNVISYDYDGLGRRISIDHPDAGLTEIEYDPAGNLRGRTTANLRNGIRTQGTIRYTYDWERLQQIDYPKYFQNKVQLHYGEVGDSLGRAGRVWLVEDGSGGHEYSFDIDGNVTRTIRTLMINRSNVFTFVSEAKYDSWGRLQTMVYPDAEALDYTYDQGGNLHSMIGEKLGTTYPVVKQLGYDKFGERVFASMGNGLAATDVFEAEKGRLLSTSVKTSNGMEVLSDAYGYDLVDNLTSQRGESLFKPTGELASYAFDYAHDGLNRLVLAEGNWTDGTSAESFQSQQGYALRSGMSSKLREVFTDGNAIAASTIDFDYAYDNVDVPSRVSEAGGRNYTYDANGNVDLINSQGNTPTTGVFDFRQNLWDEENRLLATSDNGYVSMHTYDAYGERAVKSHGATAGVFVNGAAAGFINHTDDFTAYVSPYFTFTGDLFRKHYFIGRERVSSRLGVGSFATNLVGGSELAAGDIDYKSRIQQYEASQLGFYASLNIPPGIPTIPGYYAQPENTSTGLPNATAENPYTAIPTGWPTATGEPDSLGPPGAPVWFRPDTRGDVRAGYGFLGQAQFTELEQFYYHYDQADNVRLVTDWSGGLREYAHYFPQGETWLEEQFSREGTDYRFGALEFDEESDLYASGQGYLSPRDGVELSIAGVTTDFGALTSQQRVEGRQFFRYSGPWAEDTDDVDTEVLNSEAPELVADGSLSGYTDPHAPDLIELYKKARNYREKRKADKRLDARLDNTLAEVDADDENQQARRRRDARLSQLLREVDAYADASTETSEVDAAVAQPRKVVRRKRRAARARKVVKRKRRPVRATGVRVR